MNDILELKGEFNKINKKPNFIYQMKKGSILKIDKLIYLKNQLQKLYEFWEKEKYIDGALITIEFVELISKSNRYSLLDLDLKIVGARFIGNDDNIRHAITYHISLDELNKMIEFYENAIELFEKYYGIEKRYDEEKEIKYEKIVKTNFQKILKDATYIKDIYLYETTKNFNVETVINLFEVTDNMKKLLDQIGIEDYKIKGNDAILLSKENYLKLKDRAPYLISMALKNINEIAPMEIKYKVNDAGIIDIPRPQNEPIIGVIDTLFDENVYFSEWVEYIEMLDENIPRESKDKEHGTAVSSIIVDGPTFNPDLEDNCGRFRVRHFGVSKATRFSSFEIMKKIEKIVMENRDIKVWNLCFGSIDEITQNYISFEAEILDKLQYEYDVIFIVAGTNDSDNCRGKKYIGAPADSLNSIVVNAVDRDKKIKNYTRKGPVLHFFNKPDISYYGDCMVIKPTGNYYLSGTSFAAPWITRKVAYLIYVLGFSKETAKALIIHNAANWNKLDNMKLKGFGVVSKRIEDIISSNDDEIQFIINTEISDQEINNLTLPVPKSNEKFPYIAKATLCYFSNVSRRYGVDYTVNELDLYFGVTKNSKEVKTINENMQDVLEKEKKAREEHFKWNNVKHIAEDINKQKRSKKSYIDNYWGIKIKSKYRNIKKRETVKCSLVVTLKNLEKENRISEFIQNCTTKNWLVNRINHQTRIKVYNKLEEEVVFE